MLASSRWINDHLDPPATPEEQIDLLTRAGFPVESFEDVETPEGPDRRLDVETTSNRGDCLCHLGLAREIAAMTAGERRVTYEPARPDSVTDRAAEVVRVTNEEHARCPRYTARVIRGVRVAPSPAWLQARLIARGDQPRNNIVDATNFVLFELGQPTHVFDLARLKGPEIRIRSARGDEPFLPIGEGAREIRLHPEDLVIADAERAVALAGVKGGALTAVTEETTDVLLEAAAFAPGAVRAASRRHGIASDSSYRFERLVHPDAIDEAANRLAALIMELAGGELLSGVVEDRVASSGPRTIILRPHRACALLGVDIDTTFMHRALERLGLSPTLVESTGSPPHFDVSVPARRTDLEREIDLIEEIGRLHGYEHVPVRDRLSIPVQPPQPSEAARRAVANELTAMGFTETVTHTLISRRAAECFQPPDLSLLSIEDERAKADPMLRPSLIPSLLRVARTNLDHGASTLRLFESASIFARRNDETLEERVVTLVLTGGEPQTALRQLRGAIDRLVHLLRGHRAAATLTETDALSWFTNGAALHLDGRPLGTLGVLTPKASGIAGISGAVVAAELSLTALYDDFPPSMRVEALPAFPSIERDITAIVPESVRWSDVESLVDRCAPPALEATEFVTVYRGKSLPPKTKSLSLRLRFRAANRTLTHDEVDAAVNPIFLALERDLQAVIRREQHA